jgi:hypothetical protein
MINTNICEYLVLSHGGSQFQCQNPATYKCSHCPSSFCLIHGVQHQQDTKRDIVSLLNDTQVSNVHITKEKPQHSESFEMDILVEAYTLIQLRKYSITNYHIFNHFEKNY